MAKVAGVKFPYSLKINDFLYDGKFHVNDFVVVESPQGLEIGRVVYLEKDTEEDSQGKVLRKATEKDLRKKEELDEAAKDLFKIFSEKIKKHDLKMNPVGVNFSLDESAAVFYFTSDGRVDFRELVKDMSRHIKKQAIMRQIGPRDQAKIIGGYGRCGLPICCASFTINNEGITIEDVEGAYGMPKNAAKVSGICGRLMCCIKFEEIKKGKKGKKK
ncbi:MAG: regulatory iron-sulfur-containing complex subunit RicT [Patescibacteria group bacterium]|nr:regulatory iron-sulfur-containing complex subunit RicT [Patescibacteria group bacterium]